MQTRKHLGFGRPLLLAAVVSGGLALGFSQTKPTTQSKPNVPAQSQAAAAPSASKTAWIKDPNSVMPMRQMTKAQRRAAAERNKTRRAKAASQNRQGTTSTQGGVQR
jgi:hypothetical protein